MQQFGKNCIRVRSQIIHFDAYPTWIATSDVKTWLTSIWRAEVFWSTVCMNLIVYKFIAIQTQQGIGSILVLQ
jgi:hypothetical protein